MSGSPLAAPSVRIAPRRFVSSAPAAWITGIQHLSLDIVAGVACAAAFAVAATGASMPRAWWFLLPLATWVVYASDHLLDARRTGALSQPRRRFYHRRFRGLTGLTLVLSTGGALSGVVLLPTMLVFPALAVASAAALHLVLAQGGGRRVPKEFTAALIYVGAVWFGPFLLAPRVSATVLALTGLHLIAVLANLLAFALFEERADALDGYASIVRSWGRLRTRRLLGLVTALGVVGVGLAGLLGPPAPPAALLVLLVLIAIPSVMLMFPRVFAPGERYRTVGDGAFLLMVLPFLLAGAA